MLKQIIHYFQTNSQEYARFLAEHLQMSLFAWIGAIIIGLPLGLIAYKQPTIRRSIISLSQFARILPSLAVLFILIPLVGVGQLPALIALIFLGLPSIVINTCLGFQEIPPAYIEVGNGLGMTAGQRLWQVEVPTALPFILNGIKLAWIEIIASATLATYIGAGGLGSLIHVGLRLYRFDLLIIGGVSVALLSWISLLLFNYLIRKVVRHA